MAKKKTEQAAPIVIPPLPSKDGLITTRELLLYISTLTRIMADRFPNQLSPGQKPKRQAASR